MPVEIFKAVYLKVIIKDNVSQNRSNSMGQGHRVQKCRYPWKVLSLGKHGK